MSTVLFTLNRPTNVTQEDINNILITAFEGGINYWCCSAELLRSLETPGDASSDTFYTPLGFEWVLYDAETRKAFDQRLTLETLKAGLEKWFTEHRADDIEDVDAYAADCIVQLALFGDIIFG